jgi:outer membrane protein
MKKQIYLLLTIVFATLTTVLNAQTNPTAPATVKIGYTNVEYILSKLPEVKVIETQLKDYSKQLETQLQNKYMDYQKKLEEYQQGVKSGLMPSSVIADKEKELMGLQTSIKEFEQMADEDLQNKEITLLEPVLEKVQQSIDKVADANGYTYIFSSHVQGGSAAIILYARNKEKEDISDLVLKDLGVDPNASIAAPTTPATNHSLQNQTQTPAPAKTTTPTKK